MDMKAGGVNPTLLLSCPIPYVKTCDHKANQKKVLLNTFFMDVYKSERHTMVLRQDDKGFGIALPHNE